MPTAFCASTFQLLLQNAKTKSKPFIRFSTQSIKFVLYLDDYLEELNTIRQKTLANMQDLDDSWLETSKDFFGNSANIHYYWFHYLQDEVRHTGQITMMRKHLIANNDPDFNAYDFRKKT